MEQLRAAKKRAQAEFERSELIRFAAAKLEGCAGYATRGMAISVEPGESRALEEERAGLWVTSQASDEFCQAWVRTRWVPAIDAVLKVVNADVVDQFEPQLPPDVRFRPEVIRIAFRTVHRLFDRLLKDKGAENEVVRRVAELWRELGGDRFLIQQVFHQLALHVDHAARSAGDRKDSPAATPPAQAPGNKTSPPVTTPVSNEPIRLSAPELAERFGVPPEALRKALERYRQANPDKGYIEASDRGRKEPKYVYDLAAVLHVIEGVKGRATKEDDKPEGPT